MSFNLPFPESVPSLCCVHVVTGVSVVQVGSWILFAVKKERIGNQKISLYDVVFLHGFI